VFLLGMVVASLAGRSKRCSPAGNWSGCRRRCWWPSSTSGRPVRNGQRVWSVYRVADAAFLIAAVALHHLTGEGDFDG
jgi:NADH-quinone oxidoreductase subunit L